MVQRSAVLAALAVLAAALAGCTSSPAAPEPAPPQPEAQEQARLLSPEELANATSQESAETTGQGEFARTLEERFHTHNYWNGGLEKLLMDADVASGPAVPFDTNNPFESTFRLFFRLGFGGVGFTPFELPEGSIIPPESERVEITVTWPESPTITGLGLAYMSAMSKDIEDAGPFPAGGGTVVIPTNLSMNDMPHTTVSKWRFILYPEHPQDGAPGVFNGTAHVTIKVFRNDTLFLAPPHPDYWLDNTQLLLLEANGTMQCTRAVFPLFLPLDGTPANCDNGFAFHELPNGTIVPPHTGALTVELTWANSAATDPFRTRPDLVYVPANTRRFTAPENAQVEEGRAVYTIIVDPKMVDSPYAEVSGWEFILFLNSEAPTDNGFFGGVGAFQGEYSLRILAEREQVV